MANENVNGKDNQSEQVKIYERFNIVAVCDTKNFILDAILDYLKANNVTINKIAIKEELMNTGDLNADYILIKAEDFVNINYGCLVKIKKHCLDSNSRLIILGYTEEITAIKNQLDADIVAMSLVRQSDVQTLKNKVLDLIFNKKNDKKLIMAVDDSGLMLRTLSTWLENDYELVLANSAAKAMNLLNGAKPDLILLDYEMPICSGAQFFKMIQGEETTKDIPVIFLTSKDDKETVTEVVSLRPAGYILKTTTKEQILSKICQVLDKEN